MFLCGVGKAMDAQNDFKCILKEQNFGTEVPAVLNGNFSWKECHFRYRKRRCQRCNRRCKETGIITAMLMRDAQESADAVAKETGIDEVHANCFHRTNYLNEEIR